MIIDSALKNKMNSYYEMERPDVADLVPKECRRILEIGCGFGGLGRLLKSRSNVELHGVEINSDSGKHLNGVYNSFVLCNIEDCAIDFPHNYFDCIIFADVLEHLYDPWAVLKRLSKYLKSDGCVVASIPNLRNLGLLYNLIVRGKWTYTDAGLLDKTHLRFFTYKEIDALFRQADLRIEMVNYNKDGYSMFRELLMFIPVLLIPDLKVSQFIVRARKDS